LGEIFAKAFINESGFNINNFSNDSFTGIVEFDNEDYYSYCLKKGFIVFILFCFYYLFKNIGKYCNKIQKIS
jgi:hypothetical protein